ncbi:MAG TPA: hypothetical protein VFI05_02650 [Nitrospiraceae bacterium]|nr:hypothetical protein [Nitrospiraceae bacterium]
MSTNARRMALVLLLWLLSFVQPLSTASAITDNPTLETIVSEYDRLKPKVMALATDIREARKTGQVIESGKVLLVRKDVGELVKTLRRYDKDHLRAAKGAKTYPDREKILRLFHVCDAIHRLLEAETKATDFQMLGLKYEEMWRQADAALAGSQTVDR